MAGTNKNIRKGNVTPGCAIGRTLPATLHPRQKFITKSRAKSTGRRPAADAPDRAGPDAGHCIRSDRIAIAENYAPVRGTIISPALFDPVTF
jgi:hypothetical protein